MKPEIKICGITTQEDITYLKNARVQYGGIVLFFEKSKRYVTTQKAQELLKEFGSLKSVAVVVSPTVEQVELIEETGFDYIQIHGELKPEVITKCTIPIFVAINVENDIQDIEHFLENERIAGILFDSKEPGSGKTFDWDILKSIDRKGKKLILAGGLDSENVVEGIRKVSPDIVDVSSGVEYLPDINGIVKAGKDPIRIKEFINKVRMEKE